MQIMSIVVGRNVERRTLEEWKLIFLVLMLSYVMLEDLFIAREKKLHFVNR